MSSQPANRLLADALEVRCGLQRRRELHFLSSTIVSGGRLWAIKGVEMPPTLRLVTTEAG